MRAGKHIERLVRRWYLRLLRSRRTDTGSGIIELPPAPRILLIRHDRLGDAVVSTPCISLLRDRFPDAMIGLLLGRKNRASHALLGGVDLIHHLDPNPSGYTSAARELRRTKYDLVINLLAKDSASGALLTVLSGAGYRIGFTGEAASIYDRAVEHPPGPTHIVSRTSRLLAPLGIEPIGELPRSALEHLSLSIPVERIRRGEQWWAGHPVSSPAARVVVNISASAPSKLWDDDRTRDLLDILRDQGIAVAVASAPEDRHRLERIVAPGAHIALDATSSLAEYCGMLSHADVVITPDTSVVHFAAALGCAVVMIAAADAAASWHPWGVPYRIVGSGDSSPALVPVSMVADAFNSLHTEIERARGASSQI